MNTSTPVSSPGKLQIEELPMAEYAALLAAREFGTPNVYQEPEWLTAVALGMGLRTMVLGLRRDGELLGVMPGFLMRKWGIRIFGSPVRGSMTPYMGWLARPEVDLGQTLEATWHYCARTLYCPYAQISLLHPPTTLAAQGLPQGWHRGERETYLLDLTPGEEALWSRLGKRGRAKVRKAERSGVSVEPVTDRAVMELLFPMVEAAYARHRAVSPHPERLFLELYDRLVPRGMLQVFAAWFEGQVIAMSLVPHDHQHARVMTMASQPDFNRYFPNNLLHWHTVAWACRSGLQCYDFGGKGNPTIDRFKETFGPTVHSYSILWRATPALAWTRGVALRAWPRLQDWRYRLRQLTPRGAPMPEAAPPEPEEP